MDLHRKFSRAPSSNSSSRKLSQDDDKYHKRGWFMSLRMALWNGRLSLGLKVFFGVLILLLLLSVSRDTTHSSQTPTKQPVEHKKGHKAHMDHTETLGTAVEIINKNKDNNDKESVKRSIMKKMARRSRGDVVDRPKPIRKKKTNLALLKIKGKKYPFSDDDLITINEILASADLGDIVKWAKQAFSNAKWGQFTSFGASGMVVLNKLDRVGLLKSLPVVTIDTLHLFRQSYEFISRVRETYPSMNLHIYKPKDYATKDDISDEFGYDFWKDQPDEYSYLTKVEPTSRALNELKLDVWITGRRRDQGGARSKLDILEKGEHGLKFNPLARWTYEDVWEEIKTNNIPYNPLYDDGYKSIGDTMTTIRVKPGDPERAGRWAGSDKSECGMHTHLEKVKKKKEEAFESGQEFTMPVLPCAHCINVTGDTFHELVMAETRHVVVEFYSPMCGHCQKAAPKYAKLAEALLPYSNDIVVTRMDATTYEVPEDAEEFGYAVAGFPSVYLQKRGGAPPTKFEGVVETAVLLSWLKDELKGVFDDINVDDYKELPVK